MQQNILITGAPGNVGTALFNQLQAAGLSPRAAAHNPAAARSQLGEAADIVPFDFLNPASFGPAFDGITRLFLVRPPALSNVERDIAPAVRAAVAAGVQHIVFLSLQGVENNRVVPHYKIEQLIMSLGLGYSFLRASFFMQNLSSTHSAEIRDRHEISVPVGNARTSFIDVRDIAAVAAHILMQPKLPAVQKFTLTGAEALDYDTIARTLTQTLGHSIRYTRPSAPGFLWRQLREGSKPAYALVMTALYTITRMGNASEVTQDVMTLLGRPPISFAQFAQDYRAAWQAVPQKGLDSN